MSCILVNTYAILHRRISDLEDGGGGGEEETKNI